MKELLLLKQILVISAELKEKLDEYIRRFDGKVKIIRKKERHGLIRAKLAGAKEATGDIVVFLDSHCEANHGWYVDTTVILIQHCMLIFQVGTSCTTHS